MALELDLESPALHSVSLSLARERVPEDAPLPSRRRAGRLSDNALLQSNQGNGNDAMTTNNSIKVKAPAWACRRTG